MDIEIVSICLLCFARKDERDPDAYRLGEKATNGAEAHGRGRTKPHSEESRGEGEQAEACPIRIDTIECSSDLKEV